MKRTYKFLMILFILFDGGLYAHDKVDNKYEVNISKKYVLKYHNVRSCGDATYTIDTFKKIDYKDNINLKSKYKLTVDNPTLNISNKPIKLEVYPKREDKYKIIDFINHEIWKGWEPFIINETYCYTNSIGKKYMVFILDYGGFSGNNEFVDEAAHLLEKAYGGSNVVITYWYAIVNEEGNVIFTTNHLNDSRNVDFFKEHKIENIFTEYYKYRWANKAEVEIEFNRKKRMEMKPITELIHVKPKIVEVNDGEI